MLIVRPFRSTTGKGTVAGLWEAKYGVRGALCGSDSPLEAAALALEHAADKLSPGWDAVPSYTMGKDS